MAYIPLDPNDPWEKRKMEAERDFAEGLESGRHAKQYASSVETARSIREQTELSMLRTGNEERYLRAIQSDNISYFLDPTEEVRDEEKKAARREWLRTKPYEFREGFGIGHSGKWG
jgi:hypothetical protein